MNEEAGNDLGRYPLLVKPWVKQFVYAPHWRVFWQDVSIEPHEYVYANFSH